MVKVTIDDREIEVENGSTIMEAANRAGIPIPKLCYLKDINEIGACRVCVVEIEGKEKLVTSCNNQVEEGMVVYTNSAKVRRNRRKTIEMILSQHNTDCVTCARNRNCSLQTIAIDSNIPDMPYEKEPRPQPWNKNFPLIRDNDKCIKCMRCIQVCDKIQDVKVWDIEGTGSRTDIYVAGNRKIEESDCTLCGQCVTHCPVGALRARDDTEKAWWAIDNKDKVTVVQVAPAVRTAWGRRYFRNDRRRDGGSSPFGLLSDDRQQSGRGCVSRGAQQQRTEVVERGGVSDKRHNDPHGCGKRIGKTAKLIKALQRGEVHYDFVEVMACPGDVSAAEDSPLKTEWRRPTKGAKPCGIWTGRHPLGSPMKILIS